MSNELPNDKLIGVLHKIIKISVKAMALLMTLSILYGVVDIAWSMWEKFLSTPKYIVTINDILALFSDFMIVLIAIEIFVNIVLYLRDDVIHVKIVIDTALMAIARKVIVLDFEKLDSSYLWGVASVVLATSIAYFIINARNFYKLKKE